MHTRSATGFLFASLLNLVTWCFLQSCIFTPGTSNGRASTRGPSAPAVRLEARARLCVRTRAGARAALGKVVPVRHCRNCANNSQNAAGKMQNPIPYSVIRMPVAPERSSHRNDLALSETKQLDSAYRSAFSPWVGHGNSISVRRF